MSQSKQSVVVRDGEQISSEDFGIIYRNLCDWQTELIVRKWMKKKGSYWADVSTLQNACLEMSIPSAMAE
eukprot:3905845-Pleurochrysis_carterae.AAC.1